LAARGVGRKPCHSGHGGVERAFADRLAGRHRHSAVCLRSVGVSWLARGRTADCFLQAPGGGPVDASAAGLRVVLSGHGPPLPGADSSGGASQHYRADISNFFGVHLNTLLPFNLARTWHVQLAIFWVATSYLAAGIFLAPMIAGREPRRQHWLAYALLTALAIVVFGSLIGEMAGIQGWLTRGWSW